MIPDPSQPLYKVAKGRHREKGRESIWESTGRDISLVLLGRGGGCDVTVLELGETYNHHCTYVKKGDLQCTCTF